MMQAERAISVSGPLGDDVLLLQRMTYTGELSRLFEARLDLRSEANDIKLADVLGQPLTVRLEIAGSDARFYNGYVSRFAYVGNDGRYAMYEATVRPWLWFLTRTADCRIFQNMTVPDIVKKVFRDHGFMDFDESLSATYRELEYCVQYRETDFNFVSRLLEQEGIYYHFTHEDGKHTLMLADSYSAHAPAAGYEEIPYYPPDEEDRRDREHIYDWNISQEIQPGKYALTDYDFEKPRASLLVKSAITREHDRSDFEVYDYPGEYTETRDGDNYARARIEELQARYERGRGEGNARGLRVGALFSLTDYPRDDQNREYLVVSAIERLEQNLYESGGAGAGPVFVTTFTAMDSGQPFRPARITPKPVVEGPQTAVVTGPSGETIWPDNYGRVKVQFHWDREGTSDENSSCWVRVSQNWAGKNWGGMFVPHVGHEVIVEFLEGDPDRPIITGRVYNGANMPPEGLPDASTKSIIRDHGGNEIIMEGKEGEQQIRLFSPTENSLITIGLGCHHHESDGDHIARYGGKRQDDVSGDCTHTCGGTRDETISASWKTICHGDKVEKVVGPVKFSYDGIGALIHGGLRSDTFVGGKHSSFFGGQINYNAGIKYTYGDTTEKVEKAFVSQKAKTSYQIDARKIALTGTSSLQAKGGNAVINMLGSKIELISGGGAKIVLDGNNVDIHASKVTVHNSGLMKVNGDFDADGSSKQG